MSEMRPDAMDVTDSGPPDRPHLDWDEVNDLVDDRLDVDRAERARAHLAQCEQCRHAVETVRAISTTAATLAPSIDPPPAVWRAVALSISAPPVSSRHPSAAPPTPALHRGRGADRDTRVLISRRWLAAAALLLMALSAGATALYLGGTRGNPAALAAADSAPGANALPTGTLAASFVATERAYLSSVAEVEALLDAQRTRLSPATIDVMDRALATIDSAIAEARHALLADPANRAIAGRLELSYRQKLDLLRRAAELPPTT